MNNLQEATEKICELKGGLLALDTVVTTLITTLPTAQQAGLAQVFERHTELARAVLLNAPISEHTLSAFEHEVRRFAALFGPAPGPDLPPR